MESFWGSGPAGFGIKRNSIYFPFSSVTVDIVHTNGLVLVLKIFCTAFSQAFSVNPFHCVSEARYPTAKEDGLGTTKTPPNQLLTQVAVPCGVS